MPLKIVNPPVTDAPEVTESLLLDAEGNPTLVGSVVEAFLEDTDYDAILNDSDLKPLIEKSGGWFTTDAEPHLIGARCPECGTFVFPPREGTCPNPACTSETLDPIPLSRRGRIWSYTENHYPPPPPYVAADPFEPYALAAVELEAEGIVVLGQVKQGVPVSSLRVGLEMQLTIETLYADGEHEYLVYAWEPV